MVKYSSLRIPWAEPNFMAKLNYWRDEATLKLGPIFMTIKANHNGKLQTGT